jgi:hypothetical protein
MATIPVTEPLVGAMYHDGHLLLEVVDVDGKFFVPADVCDPWDAPIRERPTKRMLQYQLNMLTRVG